MPEFNKELRALLNPIMKEFSIPAAPLLELLDAVEALSQTEAQQEIKRSVE